MWWKQLRVRRRWRRGRRRRVNPQGRRALEGDRDVLARLLLGWQLLRSDRGIGARCSAAHKNKPTANQA